MGNIRTKEIKNIAFGLREQHGDRFSDDGEKNKQALREMASRPGMYRHAPDGEDLGRIYAEIAHEVPCPPSAYWPYLP